MELFIRIKDGQPFEHPIFGDNFYQAFPHIDTNNLPKEFARFERVAQPNMGIYEVYEGVTYEWADGKVKDVHHVRQMTNEEKIALQEQTKLEWDNYYPSWYFDEKLCAFKAPIPYPQDGNIYSWDESAKSWVIIPSKPSQ